jgi:hypothetical protein
MPTCNNCHAELANGASSCFQCGHSAPIGTTSILSHFKCGLCGKSYPFGDKHENCPAYASLSPLEKALLPAVFSSEFCDHYCCGMTRTICRTKALAVALKDSEFVDVSVKTSDKTFRKGISEEEGVTFCSQCRTVMHPDDFLRGSLHASGCTAFYEPRMYPPNPGDPYAVELGCICPVIDNHHGHGEPRNNGVSFVINKKCTLHGDKQ